MDDNDQGHKRGMHPEGTESPKGGSSSHIFTTEGWEHRASSLKRILTAAVAVPIGGAFIAGIISYRAGLSEVANVVEQKARDGKYDRNFTIGEKINNMDSKQSIMQESLDQCKKTNAFVLCFINNKNTKNCSWGNL